jgi:hypothetical protein
MVFCPSEGPLQKSLPAILLSVVVAFAVFPLAGCIAHAPGSGGGGTQIAVAVSPTSAVFVPVSTPTQASTSPFTAQVTGTSNQAVTWSLSLSSSSLSTASGSGLGTIDASGTYTAPQEVPACTGSTTQCELQVVVTATSNEDNSTTGQTLVNVHVIVTVSPATDTIGQGANLQFVATVTGAPSTSQGANWAGSCPTCPTGQTAGTFDPNNPGLFIAAGLQAGIDSVVAALTATSTFDNTQSGGANLTVVTKDPLGTVAQANAAAAEITCPASGGVAGGTCYKLDVSCDAIADWSAYLKVNAPTGTPLGTVIFGTGTGGTSLYDNDPSFISGGFNGGQTVIEDVLNAGVTDQGYTTVQVSFGAPFNTDPSVANGWLQGPGGVRRLACRYATVADWVYKNIHNSNTAAPYCATGNSGGSGAIGYAVGPYALASEFSLIELTSGPVMTFLHWGCSACGGQYVASNPCTHTQENMCYSVSSGGTGSTAGIIDLAYQAQGQTTPTLCTNGVNGDGTNYSRFLSDSIEDDPGISPAIQIPNPSPTNVNVVFGTLDTTNAVPQGNKWWTGVGPQPPNPTCVADAPHAIPSVADGASQIVSDIQTMCVVH